jgi:hypothetical protein
MSGSTTAARRPEYRRPAAELRQLLKAGEGYAGIARMDDVGENVVRYRARKLGLIDLVNGKRPSRAALELALAQSDVSLKALARRFGIEPATLTRAARDYGLPTDPIGRERLRDSR